MRSVFLFRLPSTEQEIIYKIKAISNSLEIKKCYSRTQVPEDFRTLWQWNEQNEYKKKTETKYEIFGIWYVGCITKIHHYSGSCSNQTNRLNGKWNGKWRNFVSHRSMPKIFNEYKRRNIQNIKTQWNRCLQTICVYHFDWLYLWFDVTNPSRFGSRRETKKEKKKIKRNQPKKYSVSDWNKVMEWNGMVWIGSERKRKNFIWWNWI